MLGTTVVRCVFDCFKNSVSAVFDKHINSIHVYTIALKQHKTSFARVLILKSNQFLQEYTEPARMTGSISHKNRNSHILSSNLRHVLGFTSKVKWTCNPLEIQKFYMSAHASPKIV